METLLGLFSGQDKEEREVIQALAALAKEKEKARVELENSAIQFHARITVKSGMVIIEKPPKLRKELKKGDKVRMTVPFEGGERDLRLEVLNPYFSTAYGAVVFLCDLPVAFAAESPRKSPRINTTAFNTIHLVLKDFPHSFRVVDLSRDGCRFHTAYKELLDLFIIGSPLAASHLTFGRKIRVGLGNIIPRKIRGKTVGCEMTVNEDGHAREIYRFLLDSLDQVDPGMTVMFEKLEGFEERIAPLVKEQKDTPEPPDPAAGRTSGSTEVIQTLSRLIESKQEVNIYLENTKTYVQTSLLMIGPLVLFAKPEQLKGKIHNGSFVKFKVPGDAKGRALQFEVLNPHLVHSNGHTYFLCNLPAAFSK